MSKITNLSQILEYNEEHRIHKIPNIMGLTKIEDMGYSQKFINDIGGSLILPKKHISIVNNESEIIVENKQEYFNEYCNEYFPIIYNILNNVPGVVLCGGAALWLYNQSCIQTSNKIYTITRKNIPKDFDLFIYESEDLSPEELEMSQNKKINDIIHIILKDNVFTTRAFIVKGVITLQLYSKQILNAANNICIQIILRDYYSISEILHSFDIPCCSIGWDGKTTYLTKLAEWAIINNINVVIPKYRSNTYESRLTKYFNKKKYGILLPNLKLLKGDKLITLPNMSIDIHHTDNNIAIADINLPAFDSLDLIYSSQEQYEEVDYDKIASDCMINLYNLIDVQKIVQKNCHTIIKYKQFFEKYCYFYEKNKFYDFVKLPISKIISIQDYKKWAKSHIKKNIIYYQDEYILNEALIKEITNNDYEQFAITNNIETIKLQLEKLNENISNKKCTKIVGGKLFMLNKLISKLLEYIISIYEHRKDEIINYNIYLNRNEPLTGSLHPSKQTPYEWYGAHYSENTNIKQNSIRSFVDSHISDLLENPRTCPLCLENIHYLGDNSITLKCGHLYHEHKNDICEGINTWFSKSEKPICPECRKNYPKKEIKFYEC